ncbi:MAG: tripartite tricarboxylate transporter TctB family protein [Rhodoferax sp.]|nr:tripartite tricarboxylate transporter TctB family protein [Rhodoferax sp.]
MKIKSQKDFYSGVMFAVVGVAFGWGANAYSVGSAARMGAGYFPLWLGIILAAMGALVMFKSLVVETEDGDRISKWAWRPLCYIIGANLIFGVLLGGLPSIGLPSMGMVAAIYALTFISSHAGETFKWKPTLVLASILAVGSYFTFIVALKLQIQVWPTFIAG